ncbi:MAG: hypothetical protein F4X99_05510 [Gammaproteobacteria bacterium]|nr:hypothetical protein [Gammaproteobacteria bacterium]
MKTSHGSRSPAFESPEDAYHQFFRADSAKDAEGWAAVMSYPHVRVSARGTGLYFETPVEYAAGASWSAREATGWVRSVGVEPVRVHESADKVHLAGGWTRYNANDEPILRNRVTYILTRIDGSWGIQARFGTDSFREGEAVDASAPIDVVREHLNRLAAGDFDVAGSSVSHPLVDVGIGHVDRYRNHAQVVEGLAAAAGRPRSVLDVHTVQAGTRGAVVAATWEATDGARVQAVLLVGRPEGAWRIGGRSIVAP